MCEQSPRARHKQSFMPQPQPVHDQYFSTDHVMKPHHFDKGPKSSAKLKVFKQPFCVKYISILEPSIITFTYLPSSNVNESILEINLKK